MIVNEIEFCSYLKNHLSKKSVALVGSSPILLEKNDGDYIDSHDVVIRFNDARIDGLHTHTGRKTTIRFLGSTLNDRHKHFFENFQEDSILITKDLNVAQLQEIQIQIKIEIVPPVLST